MLPTAYYYGSRRGVVLAGAFAIAALVADSLRKRALGLRQQFALLLAPIFVGCVLLNFYSVRQLGPETGGASTWTLDSPLYTHATWFALIVSKLVIYWVLMAPRGRLRPSDTAAAAGLLSASVLVELAGANLPREAFLSLFVALAVGTLTLRHQIPSSLFAGALLLLDHLYGRNASHLAPIEMLIAGVATLLAWQSANPTVRRSAWIAGLTVTVGVYLMFWPMVGFHLAGLDFAFMFQWVPAAKYDQVWGLIALGVVVKLGLPLVLVVAAARAHLRDRGTRVIVATTLASKVALLSVLIACYAIRHSMASEQATAMLSELVLVLFGSCITLLAMPSSMALAEPRPTTAETCVSHPASWQTCA